MSEWRSCFTCLGKVCGCRKKTSKGVKAGSISFSVANEIKVELTTQGKDHDVNDVSEHERRTSLCTHSGKLKGGEEAPK